MNYRFTQLLVIVIGLLAIMPSFSESFSFKVPAKVEECIFQEIGIDVSFTVMFQVTAGGFNDIDFMIISPDKRVLYKGQRETEGTKVMKSNFAGVYSFCFSNQMSSLTEKTVSFMILVGEQSSIGVDLAKKGDMPQLEQQIMALADGVQAVKSEQYYFRMREATHRNTAESTNSRVLWWSIFEAFILVTMSAWQIYYLRRFFEVKRAV